MIILKTQNPENRLNTHFLVSIFHGAGHAPAARGRCGRDAGRPRVRRAARVHHRVSSNLLFRTHPSLEPRSQTGSKTLRNVGKACDAGRTGVNMTPAPGSFRLLLRDGDAGGDATTTSLRPTHPRYVTLLLTQNTVEILECNKTCACCLNGMERERAGIHAGPPPQ